LFGWTEFLVIRAGSVATLAAACALYFSRMVRGPNGLDPRIWQMIVAVGAILIVAVINVLGTKRGGQVQVLGTAIKVGALVAMMIQEFLTEYGHSVVGPIGRVSEALVAAKETDYDAAILDINLGDGLVYTVAEILAERGVPFVFVTGYDADSVDSRFSGIPILQKPIERESLQRIFAQGDDRAVAVN